MSKRHQTQTERDLASKARRDAAVPVEIPEEVTGQFEGEDLRTFRARRKTAERLERLEDKHDKLDKTVTETRILVTEINTSQKHQTKLLERISDDHADREKNTRARVTKLIAGGIAIATSGAVLHWLIGGH